MMRVQYIGPNIGVDGLFDQGVYEVLEVDPLIGYLRIIDESDDDYLYHPTRPQAIAGTYQGGRFEIVEDDKNGTLEKAIHH